MHYHIILTEVCNLRCQYCYEKSCHEFDNGLDKKWTFRDAPTNSEVDISQLKKLLKPEDTLIFYGGEPLLRMDQMQQIIDELPCRFCMQTNGQLLHRLPKSYLLKLDKILVSIDGTPERTRENKGKFTYENIISNVKKCREQGFTGEIVARMVITKPDVDEQVKHLLGLGLFDSVHFQIDAGFYKNDFDFEKFISFVKNYNSHLTMLLEWWVQKMEQERVYKIYPFLGMFENVSSGKPTRLMCGAGYANFTITTDGKLSACPVVNSADDFVCGSVEEGILKELACGEPCASCSYLDVCGGRCLYANMAQLWPPEGQQLICDTIIHLVDEMKRLMPRIKAAIARGIVHENDFLYEKYFGPEIIP